MSGYLHRHERVGKGIDEKKLTSKLIHENGQGLLEVCLQSITHNIICNYTYIPSPPQNKVKIEGENVVEASIISS